MNSRIEHLIPALASRPSAPPAYHLSRFGRLHLALEAFDNVVLNGLTDLFRSIIPPPIHIPLPVVCF